MQQMHQTNQYCHEKKIDVGWLHDAEDQYQPILIDSFKDQISRNQQNIQEDTEAMLVNENFIKSLCLSALQKKEEFVIQKKSSITGGYLERIGRFNKNILEQIKDKKVAKSFPPYSKVGIEMKLGEIKNWYVKGGDMARLILEFEKHAPINMYLKDKNYAIKWQRYLIIERLLQRQPKLVAQCFEFCQQIYQDKFQISWSVVFCDYLTQYTNQLNIDKKQHAKIDLNFLITMDKQVLSYHLNKWSNKSEKLYTDEQNKLEQLKKMSQQDQEKMIQNQAKMEQLRIEKEKKRKILLENMQKFFKTIKEDNIRFFQYWNDRACHFKNNRPNEFKVQFKSMLIQSNIQMVRPQLEIKFISERTCNTQDFEFIKTVNNQVYNIENNPYLVSKLLGQMNQQRRRNFTTWNFKEGLLGLCGMTQLQISKLGFKDYLELQVVDTIKIGTQSTPLKIQLQDMFKYSPNGRSCWIMLPFNSSYIYVELDVLEVTNMDPIFYENIELVQLSPVSRKIVVKIIEQRTPIPIVETIKFTLEADRYQDDIAKLYRRIYIENICLQPFPQPINWFRILNSLEQIVKVIGEILKRNYLEFVDENDNTQIYYQMKQVKNLRLPLIKDIEDYVAKIDTKLVPKIQSMLTSFLIYCNLRQIQLNVAFLQIIFQIGVKFIVLTHYHFLNNTFDQPVFGVKFDSEAQAFWLFVAFVEYLNDLKYPISKADQIFAPQEIVLIYLEVLQKELILHCKNNDIPLENICFEILQQMFTNIVVSIPLYNIWDLIIRKKQQYTHQIVLLIYIEELGDKLLYTSNKQEFMDALKLQAQMMDIQQVIGAYTNCEANLSRIINVQEVVHESVDHDVDIQQMLQDS